MTKPSKTALFKAAKEWDATAVASLTTTSADLVQATDPKGRTALHIACAVKPDSPAIREANGLATVTALLQAGADLEGIVPMDEDEGDFRATPLWYAVARGENLPLVRYLLDRGADASSSLWAAVWRDDPLLCRELLKNSPNLNLRAHGETPLFYAARLGRLKTLELLLDAGADPAISDKKGRNAIDIAEARRLPQNLLDRLIAGREGRPTTPWHGA